MSKLARDHRLVERGFRNVKTIHARNLRAQKRFDRWLSGIHITAETAPNGFVWWTRTPVGRGLIHNGRKP